MRSVLLIATIALLPGVVQAEQKTLTVEVSDIDVGRGGNLIVLVFAEDGFPIKHEKALLTKTEKVAGDRMILTFDAPASTHADLAFKVLHDQDENAKVTKNWTGIWPAEGLGFSNGARMRASGPPKFDDAKLPAAQALKGVALRVIYP